MPIAFRNFLPPRRYSSPVDRSSATVVARVLLMLASLSGAIHSAAADELSFTRQIQPLLARHCFTCHGPDEEHREADLRLDVRQAALESEAFVPGKPDDSELIRRIFSDDPDQRMPPASANDVLTDSEKQLLRRWVLDGAVYEQHWAFVPPRRSPVPGMDLLLADAARRAPNPEEEDRRVAEIRRWQAWPRNAIDPFTLQAMLSEGLTPSPEADRYTLVRRLYLDLIGLPPSVDEAAAFANESEPAAYDKLVQRLLESQQYGERWARLWLDLARYSDTNGYEKDRPRSIWPYRDWVIRALNDDMPFDQFTIEQLAGDMLPGATADQRVATGFHRNTMLNEEGGIDPLEYRFYAMVDRVATTGIVWLGLTTGCAQCHTHKYDPLSHEDYYRLMALLNNADEPDLIVPDARLAARRAELQQRIDQLELALPQEFPAEEAPSKDDPTKVDPAKVDNVAVEQQRQQHLRQRFAAWIHEQRQKAVDWQVVRPHAMETNLPRLELLDDGSIFSSGDITKRDLFRLRFRLEKPVTAVRLEVLPDPRLPAEGPGRAYYEGRQGDFFLSEMTATLDEQTIKFASASHSFGKISIGSGSADATNVLDGDGSTGWSTSGREGEPHQLVLNLAEPLAAAGEFQLELLFERHFAASLGRFRVSVSSAEGVPRASQLPVAIESLLVRDPEGWTDEQRSLVMRQFLLTAPELAEARKQIDQLRQQLPKFPTTLVMQERQADNPRPTFRHHRGEYLSPREPLTPGVPGIFATTESPPTNRLEFARWLVSDQNPLVARVTVNRAWRAFFGAGLVRTSGDFGTQSEPPTHPELLDWLACEFVEQGWSLKELHRKIVTSATYRQQSTLTPQLLERDPHNRLWARGPRFRVDAEVVRDMFLKSSGLMSPTMYGPSVYPPQPGSVTELAYGDTAWNTSTGADRFRRSLYTFSKRTAPFAAYTVFDGPTGENCIPRRDRSNTPLQALALLNDPMFLEMARALAQQSIDKADDPAARATWIFQSLLTRPPGSSELDALLKFQRQQQQRFDDGELKAAEVVGQADASSELATWMLLVRAVMNLDETITKP